MSPSLRWIVVLAVVVGHFGLHLSIYNRINALGLPRWLIKTVVKFFFATTWLIPLGIVYGYGNLLMQSLRGSDVSIPTLLQVYGWICLACWPVLGIPWILWRPLWGLEWVDAKRDVEVIRVDRVVDGPLAVTPACRFESRLPLNQLFDLSIERIELPVAGLPAKLEGYRLAHLSDIHLTGDVAPEYAKYVVDRATDWNPEMMALTGDIVDSQRCIAWLSEIFSAARARDGCYFILGNHDTRIVDSWQTRQAMDHAGWIDLGGRTLNKNLKGVDSLLIGNEHPWYRRPVIDPSHQADFRLLLSHSPDQLGWARRHQVQLMLAGHTHGGQGRLPLAGPLLSPSLHGSRYASGDFYKPPTTMHVSRGLGGVHLMRLFCRPELSLITLRNC
ncbi:MAG: metallophosphoesterase [Pirellulales bacterium]|nr:metallophosphoesterase [Pirellulales bacterium]